jgi:hypothetical protein
MDRVIPTMNAIIKVIDQKSHCDPHKQSYGKQNK